MKLSERVKRWRDSRNMTKAELARRLKISSAAVTQFEQGDNDPSLATIELMCVVFKTTLPEFFGEAPKAKKAS